MGKKINKKALVAIALVGITGAGLISVFEDTLIGKAPTNIHPSSHATSPNDSEEVPSAENASPEDGSGFSSQQLLLELIDARGKILSMNPNDTDSLISMANITFNQRIFDKSAEYFQRYLALVPDDIEARASYASTLTFLKKPEDSLTQLDIALEKDPKSFQANAFKSITLTQLGRNEDARKAGQLALALAPNDEAKNRFQKFLDSIDKQDNPTAPEEEKTQARGNTPSQDPSVVAFLKAHPMIGPKLVSYTVEGSTLKLFLKDFPMAAMPPVAKDSFFGKVKAVMQQDATIQKIAFFDVATGHEMASLSR